MQSKPKAERLKTCSITKAMQKRQQYRKTKNELENVDPQIIELQNNIASVQRFSYNWPLIWARKQGMRFRKCNRKREKPGITNFVRAEQENNKASNRPKPIAPKNRKSLKSSFVKRTTLQPAEWKTRQEQTGKQKWLLKKPEKAQTLKTNKMDGRSPTGKTADKLTKVSL